MPSPPFEKMELPSIVNPVTGKPLTTPTPLPLLPAITLPGGVAGSGYLTADGVVGREADLHAIACIAE